MLKEHGIRQKMNFVETRRTLFGLSAFTCIGLAGLNFEIKQDFVMGMVDFFATLLSYYQYEVEDKAFDEIMERISQTWDPLEETLERSGLTYRQKLDFVLREIDRQDNL